ncbi:AfsR/SARP family transcriptional regulator [Actinospica robiniae]|uniref:AfsR/SARP family transcriptional regulator n=1 Tax=Actinospica robiniae TaxID=304901 RepID=UPI0004240B85|nr:BTAD domain-containing putative transcriptional regulator [Actinospica robiniae]
MIFRLLGPVDVWAQQRSHSVGQIKAQTILSILLLESGRAVSVQMLAERLWDEEIPTQARETLQVYISRLRHRLRAAGDETGAIASTPNGGYRMNADPRLVDAHLLGRLIARARDATTGHDLTRARALLLEAEALWRGEPLEGLPGRWAQAARSTLLERHRNGLLARIGLDLKDEARRDDALGELTEFTRAGRIDQQAIAMLMTSLADVGRQDEALEVFRTARLRMRDELGVDPRRELTSVHEAILRGEPTTATALVAHARSGPLAPRTLDRDPPHLIGRDEKVHEVMSAAAEDLAVPGGIALFAIDGMPGIGKTALALHVAHRLASNCPDGALQISFRTHDPRQAPLDARTALLILLEALGTGSEELGPAASPDELAALWRRRTDGLRLLLVFDDVHDAGQIAPLLPVAAGSVTIVTSRQRLAHLPGARHLTLSTLNDLASTRLLARITHRQFPGKSRELRRFAARCGGLPLAVTLAAAHLRAHPTWALSDLVERLEHPGPAASDFLSAPVHRTFDLSYQTLSPPHRRLLRLAAHQPAPDLGVRAAAALLGTDTATADLLLEALVEQRLIDEVSRHRYRLHDLLRNFAAHEPPDEQDAGITSAIEHMIDYYVAATAQAERTLRPHRRLPDGITSCPLTAELDLDVAAGAHAWLETESANLLALAAYTDAPTGASHRHAGILAALLTAHLERRGLWPQAVDVLTRAELALDSAGGKQTEANHAQVLVHLAAAQIRVGALDDAGARATTALAAWRDLDDLRGQADSLLELGRIHWYSGRLQQAIDAYESSEALYRRLRLPHGRAITQYHRAIILYQQHRHLDAVTMARSALGLVAELDDQALKCIILVNLGETYRRTGRDELADPCFRQARDLAPDRADPQYLAVLALNTGILDHRAGRKQAARRSLQTAFELYESLGDRVDQVDALTALAAALAEDDPEGARARLRRAEQLLAELDDPSRSACLETTLAGVLVREGRQVEAAEHLRAAIDLAGTVGAPLEEAHAHRALHEVMAALGDTDAAHRHLRRAEELYRALGYPLSRT